MAHRCDATGCRAIVAPSMWGCDRHWSMVPPALRVAILRYYRPGQEQDKKPSTQYMRAARAAVVAVAKQEGVEPDTRVFDRFLEIA